MARILPFALVGLAVLGAACSDTTTPQDNFSVDAAFLSSPAGFASTTSSFAGDSAGGYRPEGRRGRRGHGHGGRGPTGLRGGSGFMGGGLGLDFLGGHGGGRRPFDFAGTSSDCTAAGGVTTCTRTRDGLTITRTYAFTSAAGATQSAFDSTTNTVAVRTAVAGTTTRRDSVSATVSHASQQTVTGLARGSTQRTVDGTSAGTESLAGRDSAGVAFTALRTIGDTIAGVVIPLQNGRPTYPTAGTVTRSLRVAVTSAGSTRTAARREVITYDGSANARLVVTQDGTTKTCTLPLPHGRPVCP